MSNPASAGPPPAALAHQPEHLHRDSTASTDRIARHLLRRLQHQQLWQKVIAGSSIGLLDSVILDADGFRVRRYTPATDHGLSGDPSADLIVLRQMFLDHPRSIERALDIPEDGLSAAELDALVRRSDSPRGGDAPDASVGGQSIRWPYLRVLLDSLPGTTSPADLAVVWLLSRALVESDLPTTSMLSRLTRSGNLVIIRSEVDGFAEKLASMLKAGVLNGRKARIERQNSSGSAAGVLGLNAGRIIRLINDEDLCDTPHRHLAVSRASKSNCRGDTSFTPI